MSKIDSTKYEWGWLLNEGNYFVISTDKYSKLNEQEFGLLVVAFILTFMPTMMAAVTIPLFLNNALGHFIQIICGVIAVLSFILTMVTSIRSDRAKAFMIAGNFNNSLTKVALENGTDLLTLKKWNDRGMYLQSCENLYRDSIQYGLTDEAETLKAIFKQKLPQPDTNESKNIAELIDEVKTTVEEKITVKKAELEQKDKEDRQLEREKLRREVESRKPGLAITDGSYSWNPPEVINVGELR